MAYIISSGGRGAGKSYICDQIMENILKYPKEMYVDSGIYSEDMDGSEQCHSEKLVKVRKTHQCVSCGKEINRGEYALREQCIIQGEGWHSCYTCTECIEEWLEESGQVDTEEAVD